jgi:hypothetical protein
MKKYIGIILSVILLSMKSDDDRKTLLCHKWIQFALKSHDAALPKMIDKSMAKECLFKDDGYYQETMYDNKFKASGRWFFNGDQTKMDYTVTEINGQKFPESPHPENHIHQIILKLNNDTLVYGSEAYYGSSRTYGHDDWYFVREK